MERDYIIVGHEHIMDEKCIGDNFLGIKWLQKLINKHTYPFIKLLNFVSNIIDKDALSRVSNFITNENKTQLQNLTELKKYYPDDTKFVILTINMHGMKAGKVTKSYRQQLEEVIELKKSGEPIFVFYHLEPTMSDCLDLLYEYSEYIDGIKVYPLMGHFPYHDNLLKGYEWCSENNKPVVIHTSPLNDIYFRDKKELKTRLKDSKFPLYNTKIPLFGNKKKYMCVNFVNPKGFEYIIKKYPSVNFDLAHIAGEDEIKKHISGKVSNSTEILLMIKKYENAFTDISYSFNSQEMRDYLKTLLENDEIKSKLLYGTDYYMNKMVIDKQEEYYDMIKDDIGLYNFEIISIKNPKKFHKI